MQSLKKIHACIGHRCKYPLRKGFAKCIIPIDLFKKFFEFTIYSEF